MPFYARATSFSLKFPRSLAAESAPSTLGGASRFEKDFSPMLMLRVITAFVLLVILCFPSGRDRSALPA